MMTEFWEKNFCEKKEMWGFEPAKSAVLAKTFFEENSIQNILIPGIGYGRNARIFLDAGMSINGIEISKTAIKLAKQYHGEDINIYHGSVTNMPFDNKKYDGIFCHGLIHLLSQKERIKFIQDCYNQLRDGGYMIFSTITKEASTYGQGTKIGADRFELFGGVKIFFYDMKTIQQEFDTAGLVAVTEITENYPFYLIKCKK